jgi:hypothetical protein
MSTSASYRSDAARFVIASLATAGLWIAGDTSARAVAAIGFWATNTLLAVVVLIHGFFALRHMWRLEMLTGKATLPAAWSFFLTQHATFGIGGLLTSLFNANYFYENNQGVFPWEDAIAPMLLVHVVSMTMGLLGVVIGVGRRTPPRSGQDIAFGREYWSWRGSRVTCFVTLIIHALVWVVSFRFAPGGIVGYAIDAIAYCTNAAFVLWGLSWNLCTFKSKVLFGTYASGFVLLEVVEGNRTFFLVPLMLFAIGLMVSPNRQRIPLRSLLVSVPVIFFLAIGFVKSEDIRTVFSRSSGQDLSDIGDRMQALGGSPDKEILDATGETMNGSFRLGSRLFELAAADVILRTPSALPYWGWNAEDTSVLITGALPLKLNPDATLFHSDNAGMLYLRAYGWVVDPLEGGSSMPATMIGDSWRRFGWMGVALVYLGWAWLLTKASLVLKFRNGQIAMAVFSCSVLSNVILQYTSDITTLFTSIPRRVIVIAIYSAIVMICGSLAENRSSKSATQNLRTLPETS